METKRVPRRTRSYFRQEESLMGLLLVIEPATVDEELSDDEWILAMQEELNQFQRNEVWDLVPKPENKNIIGTKWVFINKQDEFEKDILVGTKCVFIKQEHLKKIFLLYRSMLMI